MDSQVDNQQVLPAVVAEETVEQADTPQISNNIYGMLITDQENNAKTEETSVAASESEEGNTTAAEAEQSAAEILQSALDRVNNRVPAIVKRLEPDGESIGLFPGVHTEGEVRLNEFAYFHFQHTDPSKLVTVFAEPLNKTSDPDLYVSNGDKPTADKTHFTWKSCLVGADRVDIHPSDPLSKPGLYKIGVLGYTKVTQFSIRVIFSDPAPITPLLKNTELFEKLAVGSCKYFKYNVENSDKNGTIHLNLNRTAGSQDLNIYASNSVIYPTLKMNRWYLRLKQPQ